MLTQIGKFEIKTEIGHGAFGRVYRAHDSAMRRDVAIKVIDSGGDPETIKSFRNEAGTTGKLRHENILTVYDFGEQEGCLYLVMELLEGENLESVIFHRRPLSLLDKVLIMEKVGRGLQYAHENNVIHRDIKPANIMLLPNGGVKIMDFGIARLTKDAELNGSTGGTAHGTVQYMSPEQFREGATVDKLVDIFAFGAVCYELLCGVHPFDANDTATMIYRITSEDPAAIRQFDPQCPEELERVVLRALSKERETRYQSLEDLLFDTEPITRELGRQRAAALIDEVQELIRREDLEQALARIRDVLELDPVNQTARILGKKIDEDIRKSRIARKLVELAGEGKLQMERRQFSEAAQTFESALRLDKNDNKLHVLLAEAQAAQERYRKASRLVAEGRAEAQQGNLDTALKVAATALETDPGNAAAEQLRQSVQDQVEAEKRAARDRAIESKLSEARGVLDSGRFDEAERILEGAVADDPGDARLAGAILELRGRRAAAERAEFLAAAISEVRQLMSRRNYSGAKQRLQTALRDLHGDPQLKKMSERLSAAQMEFERSEEVRAALTEARTLANESEYEKALKVLSEIEARAGHDDAVLALRRQIAADRDREEETALKNVLAEVRAYLAVGVPERALPKLQAASSRFGSHPEFQKALKSAQAHIAKAEGELIDRVLEGVARFEEHADWRSAGIRLESALNRFPTDVRLARAQESLLAKIAAADRTKKSS